MKHPDFKHRAIPDGGDYENYSEVDLFAFVDGQINHIQDSIELMGRQYQPDNAGLMMSDSTNLNTLKQINISVLDLRVMFEWFLQNHEIVRTEAHHPEDYEEELEPGADGSDRILN
jgi:hypothetical protein